MINNSSEFNSQLRSQWTNPSDIMSILLIVGGDVIKAALAQFSNQSFKPLAFSFGWVAYAYTYLLSAVGRLKPMPDPEFPSYVINVRSGKVWENSSWLLGRLLHHYEMWMHQLAQEAGRQNASINNENQIARLAKSRPQLPPAELKKLAERDEQRKRSGLVVAIYKPDELMAQGVPMIDKVVWTGLGTAMIQFGIAAIPCALYREWEVLVITGCGTLLAWLMGLLQERASSPRKDTRKTFALTQGNGYVDAIIILGDNENGLDLEDLANEGIRQGGSEYHVTVAFAFSMVILWTSLLITTSGLQTNTWFLVAVGGIGMIQNIYAAGARRDPGAYGIHLQFITCIAKPRVMQTLMSLEEEYPMCGSALLPIFFPGGTLRDNEKVFWAEMDNTAQQRELDRRH
jgi:hypothetical protein